MNLLIAFLLFTVGTTTTIEKPLKTEIKEVTVFQKGAQVFESGSVNLPAGESTLIIGKRSPYLEAKSLQVKGLGDFTIIGVNVRENFLQNATKDSLTTLLEEERKQLERLNGEAEILKEKMSLLNANKNIGSQQTGLSMAQLKQALEFYEKELTSIKEGELQNRIKLNEKRKYIEKLEKQLQERDKTQAQPYQEVVIKVQAAKPTNAQFNLSYLVSNAGWFPKYDIRVNSIQEPLYLEYKAEVWQNTGNDWNAVKLRFSNGQPTQSSVVPELKKWELTYARLTRNLGLPTMAVSGIISGVVLDEDREPLPGAVVNVVGTSIGTVTDYKGSFILTIPQSARLLEFNFIGYKKAILPIQSDFIEVVLEPEVMMLSEVVVTGYAGDQLQGRVAGVRVGSATRIKEAPEAERLVAAVYEQQTTVELEVARPYSILSDGQKLTVDLKQYDIPANYIYYAVPKVEKDAFLVAMLTNWEQYSFLQGEANIFFEGTFVGKSILEAEGVQDTLSISLGRDKSIALKREKIDQLSQRKTLASNNSESRAYQITVKNNKSQGIQLTIFDQIPISIVNDISVTSVHKGAQQDENGILKWQVDLKPNEQQQFQLQYEVKYPKREKVVLD